MTRVAAAKATNNKKNSCWQIKRNEGAALHLLYCAAEDRRQGLAGRPARLMAAR